MTHRPRRQYQFNTTQQEPENFTRNVLRCDLTGSISFNHPDQSVVWVCYALLIMLGTTIGNFDGAGALLQRGGVVMWPLLILSVLSVTLMLERGWFFLRTNTPGRLGRMDTLGKRLRKGDRIGAARIADNDKSVYGDAVRRLLDEKLTEASAADAIEAQRRRLERFLPTLSTIITAAPMLGILGTVLGIISSFEVLGDQSTTRDPSLVGQGIAEALVTTAAGLVVALITLLPYNLIRAQVDRTLSRLESLVAAAMQENN